MTARRFGKLQLVLLTLFVKTLVVDAEVDRDTFRFLTDVNTPGSKTSEVAVCGDRLFCGSYLCPQIRSMEDPELTYASYDVWLHATAQSGADGLAFFTPAGKQLFCVGHSGKLFVASSESASLSCADGTVSIPVEATVPPLSALGEKVIYHSRPKDESGNQFSQLYITDGTESGTTKLLEASTILFTPNEVNGKFLFWTVDASYTDYNLWATDGTVDGTELIKGGLRPGDNSFFLFNDTLYFDASNGTQTGEDVGQVGYELWSSDGTSSGTKLVMNINPEIYAEDGSVKEVCNSHPRNFCVTGDVMYFFANYDSVDFRVGIYGLKVGGTPTRTSWTYDYIDSGPKGLFALDDVLCVYDYVALEDNHVLETFDPNTGVEGGLTQTTSKRDEAFLKFQSFNGNLYFINCVSDTTAEIWMADKTQALPMTTAYTGDVLNETFKTYADFVVFNDKLIYTTWTGNDSTLWYTTDGHDLTTYYIPTANSSMDVSEMIEIDGYVYYIDQGDLMRIEVQPDTFDPEQLYSSSAGSLRGLHYAEKIKKLFLFMIPSTESDKLALLACDIPGGDVSEVKTFPVNTGDPNKSTLDFTSGLNTCYIFHIWTSEYGWEYWTSDGTASGTEILKDVNIGVGDDESTNQEGLTGKFFSTTQSNAYYTAVDHNGIRRLWKTDGTPANTTSVTAEEDYSSVEPLVGAYECGVYFIKALNENIFLYSEVTGETYEVVTADERAAYGSSIKSMYGHNDDLVFCVLNSADLEVSLVYYNSSTFNEDTSCHLLKELGTSSYPIIGEAVSVFDKLYFVFTPSLGVDDAVLWVTDGTADGTHEVSSVNEGLLVSYPADLTNVSGKLYFSGVLMEFGTAQGYELWFVDHNGTYDLFYDFFPICEGVGCNPKAITTTSKGMMFAGQNKPYGGGLYEYPAKGKEVVVEPKFAVLTMKTSPVNGGDTRPLPLPVTHKVRQDFDYTVEALPAKDYLFLLWSGTNVDIDDSDAARTTIQVTDDTAVLTAFFIKQGVPLDVYQLTVQPDDATKGTTDPLGTMMVFEGVATDIKAFPNFFNAFDKWTSSSAKARFTPGQRQTSITIFEDTVVTANFKGITTVIPAQSISVEMAVDPADSGETDPLSGQSYSKSAGDTIEITATAAEGYDFVRWEATEGNVQFEDAFSLETVARAWTSCVITASFAASADTVSLTVEAGTGGQVTPQGTLTLSKNSTIDLNAAPDSEYVFVKWNSSTGNTSFSNANAAFAQATCAGNDTVEAEFEMSSAFEEESTKAQAKITIRSQKATSISVNNMPLNSGFVFDDSLEVIIDGNTFPCDDDHGEWSQKGKEDKVKHAFKSDVEGQNYSLTVVPGQSVWSFKAKTDGLSAPLVNGDGIDVLLQNSNGDSHGANLPMQLKASWSYKGEKTSDKSRTLDALPLFEVLSMKGKYDSATAEKGACQIQKSSIATNQPFNSDTDDFLFSIDDVIISVPAGYFTNKNGEKYQYKSEDKTQEVKLDLDKKTCSVKVKQEDVSSIVQSFSTSSELTVGVYIGDEQGTVTIAPDVSCSYSWKYGK